MTVRWEEAADDVFTYLNQGKRAFPAKKMLSMLDDLAIRGMVTQSQLSEAHGSENFVATTLSNITTAVHGKGSVPRQGGWYQTSAEPYAYTVEPLFAEAWRKKRGLNPVAMK